MMEKFSSNGALMYVKKPNRVELRFEKAFTLSVLKNNLLLIQAFPDDTIKTCLVSMKPLGDLEQGKDKEDLITTPLHLACKLSNDEAVRQLINEQSYDVNILCNEKSALGELLSTACYLDFSILNFLMKKRKPCINSGLKLPLNQAILRGNPFIIRSLIEFGKPHPFLRDHNGKSAIHIAAAKLDMQTFDSLVSECGADPMQTDLEGNTILHILTLGVITDAEYDFVKFCLQKYGMRLSRNLDKRSPIGILKSYATGSGVVRGQPNFKKKLVELLERIVKEDPQIQDADGDQEIHKAVVEGQIEGVKRIVESFGDNREGKIAVVEWRNHEGKTAVHIAIERRQEEIARYLIEVCGEQIDMRKRDTINGNTYLHLACINESVELAELIY